MGWLYGVAVWGGCMGWLYGLSVWGGCMGWLYGAAVWGGCMGRLYGVALWGGCTDCPQVIAPEEIADPNVDEHSVMTYLSQFPKAKLKPGAPLRPRAVRPERVRAYGPGTAGGALGVGGQWGW